MLLNTFSRKKGEKIVKNQDGGLKVPLLTFSNFMFRCQNLIVSWHQLKVPPTLLAHHPATNIQSHKDTYHWHMRFFFQNSSKRSTSVEKPQRFLTMTVTLSLRKGTKIKNKPVQLILSKKEEQHYLNIFVSLVFSPEPVVRFTFFEGCDLRTVRWQPVVKVINLYVPLLSSHWRQYFWNNIQQQKIIQEWFIHTWNCVILTLECLE